MSGAASSPSERWLNGFFAVTRVSLDVGTMGQLGGQAVVTGVEGTWKTCAFRLRLGCREASGADFVLGRSDRDGESAADS